MSRIIEKRKIYNVIVEFLKGYGARKITIFGSFARGENTTESDIDIIVEFSDKKSLIDIVRIERELSEKLGIKVDLLTNKSLSPYIAEEIQKDVEVIYE